MKLKMTEVFNKDLPDWLKKELEEQQDKYGAIRMSKLSDEAKVYMREKIKDSVEAGLGAMEGLITSHEIGLVTEGAPALTDGLLAFNSVCGSAYHIKELRPELLKVYNACAAFIREYNEVDVDHKGCPVVSLHGDTEH